MIVNLDNIVTPEKFQECKELAVERTKLQRKDSKNRMRSASFHYGEYKSYDDSSARNFEQQYYDHFMGAIAEYVGSVCAKCLWPKVMNQYKDKTPKPDLSPTYKGKVFECDVRSTRKYSTFIYRVKDIKHPDMMLIVVSNLPDGPNCQVGHKLFGDVTKMANEHSEWIGSHPGAPYYEIPFKCLNGDFSEFGN